MARIVLVLVLGGVVGCGDRTVTALRPPVSSGAPSASRRDTTGHASSDPDASASSGTYKLERPSLDAPDVDVSWTDSGGTTHCADRVRIRDRAGSELLIETPEDAFQRGRPLAPLLEIAVRLQGARTLLLGWSSTGGGEQTYHAIVVTNVAPEIVGELRWSDGRGGPGIAVSGATIGIPEPSSLESELAFGRVRRDREALDASSYEPPPGDATFYAAPFKHDEARSRAARYTWFEIGDVGPIPP